jgi:hypothetical protein
MKGMNDHSTPSIPPRRGLASLWVARDLTFLGNWVAFIALLAWTYRATESAGTAALLVVAWMLLPILLRPIAAVLVDAGNAWAVGSVAQLLRAAALLPLLTVSLDADLRTVLIVAFLASAPAAFVRASHIALLPTVAGSARLERMGSALFTTRLLAMVAGATASVFIFRMDELRGMAIAVAAAFILSAVLTAMAISGRPGKPATPRRSLVASITASQRELLRALQHPMLQPVVVVHLLLMLLIGGTVVARTAFVTWGLFMPNENLGFLLAAQGAGLVVAFAGYRYGRRRYPSGTLVAAGVLVAALAEFGFILTRDVPPAAAFNFVIGLGIGFALLGLGSGLREARGESHEEADHAMTTGLAMATGVAVLVSAVVIGAVVDAITARFTIALLSGMLMILAVYAFGALPVLKASGREPVQAVEKPLSTLLPD